MERFLIVGHRGSPRRQPENTAASFDEALSAGADGFETDLRLLRDGTAVLFHDDELRDLPVEDYTFAVCRREYPLLEPFDSLERFAGRGWMILEVKRRGWERELMRRVAGWPSIVVASFDHLAIAELARLGAPFPLGLTILGSIASLPEYARRVGATWCFPSFRHLDAESVAALHAGGIRVVPWTANRPGEWQRLRAIGCDGVITDLPAEAVAWRDAAGPV